MSGGAFDKIVRVYKITSPSGKVYVGSSSDIMNRVCKYKRLKCKSQTRLYNSLCKYGWENHTFKILEECELSEILFLENKYGRKLSALSSDKGLNCRLPKIDDIYTVMSQETKNRIGKANKGKSILKSHYKSKLKKLTINQVIEIKKLLVENKLTQLEISKIFKVSRKIISNINSGRTYRTVGAQYNLKESNKKYVKLSAQDIADSIQQEIDNQGKEKSKEDLWMSRDYYTEYPDERFKVTYSPEVVKIMEEGIEALKKAYVYAQRIDWYLSGDDGKESLVSRLEKDLKELSNES